MATTNKIFGVYLDGDELKVALLSCEKEIITIETLFKEKLVAQDDKKSDRDFYGADFAETFSDGTHEPPPDSFDFTPMAKGEDLEFEEVGEFFDESADESHVALSRVAHAVQFTSAPLALNLDVSNISYKKIVISAKTSDKKILDKIKRAFYTPDAVTMSAYSWFQSGEDEIVGIRHEGSMDLLENLVTINQNEFENRFQFKGIHPNEVALINSVRYNYEIFGLDMTAIFYIGNDFCRITLMQGEDFYLELPIINEGYKKENILNTIYSRFLLEKAHHDIPALNRIFLAGNNITQEKIDFIKEKEPDAIVETLLPVNILPNPNSPDEYSDKELTEYIIPISLAAMHLQPKSPKFLKSNFLPRQLKHQNLFSLGLTGIFMIAVILATTFFSISSIVGWKDKNKMLMVENSTVKSRIESNNILIDSLNVIRKRIENYENNISWVKKYIGEDNQWHYILEEVSSNFLDHSLSWSTNIHKEEDRFKLEGSTTKRTNIVGFSQMFPFGSIEKVEERQVESYTVWDYQILFNMPDPLTTKISDSQKPDSYIKRYKEKAEEVAKPKKQEKKAEKPREEEKKQEMPQPQPKPDPEAEKPKEVKATPKAAPKQEEKKTAPKETPVGKALYDEAVKLHFGGKHAEAAVKFKEYIDKYRDNLTVNATYFLGECNYKLGKREDAERLFVSVLDTGKAKVPETLLMLGILNREDGKLNIAHEYWNDLVQRYPNSTYADIARKKIAKYKR